VLHLDIGKIIWSQITLRKMADRMHEYFIAQYVEYRAMGCLPLNP
jgi:hypothetical protein